MSARKHSTGIQIRLTNWAFLLVLLVLAYILKRHYSRATAQELEWILGPIAAVVGWAGGISFDSEIGTGFISRSRGIIIAPACAGLNFMIVAILSAGWGTLPLLRTACQKAAGLPAIVLSAYALTIAVNSLRILLSIHLYRADIYTDWITPERVHRLTGIVLYVICLCCYYQTARWLTSTRGQQKNVTNTAAFQLPARTTRLGIRQLWPKMIEFTWTPLFWYVVLVVGVPLANGAHRQSLGRFGEHCLAVSAGCALVISIFFLVRYVFRRKFYCCKSPRAPEPRRQV